jgi:hypothetical protein
MANFFSRLAERTLGSAPVAQPDLSSMFAPLAAMELSTEISARSESARAERSTSGATSQNAPPQTQPTPSVERPHRDAEIHPPLVNVRQTKSELARDRVQFAAEDINLKSESGRALDNSSNRDHVRASADEARPQIVSRETLVRQAARSAIPDFASSTAGRLETPTPTIQVSIGRVEVRAVTLPTQGPRIVERKAPPLLSLDQYLRERNEGRR